MCTWRPPPLSTTTSTIPSFSQDRIKGGGTLPPFTLVSGCPVVLLQTSPFFVTHTHTYVYICIHIHTLQVAHRAGGDREGRRGENRTTAAMQRSRGEFQQRYRLGQRRKELFPVVQSEEDVRRELHRRVLEASPARGVSNSSKQSVTSLSPSPAPRIARPATLHRPSPASRLRGSVSRFSASPALKVAATSMPPPAGNSNRSSNNVAPSPHRPGSTPTLGACSLTCVLKETPHARGMSCPLISLSFMLHDVCVWCVVCVWVWWLL